MSPADSVALLDPAAAAALRHIAAAEAGAARVPGVGDDTPTRPVQKVGIVGAGTMGTGIAASFAAAGITVVLADADAAALGRGLSAVAAILAKRAPEAVHRVAGATDLAAVADADLVVEAVFEAMPVKDAVFRELDRIARPGAILATNTSSLDVDAIAAATRRPRDVVGLHFFSPAHVMRLVEIVRGRQTAPDVLKTSVDLARRLGKVGVTVGVCPGFVGNRMLRARTRQVDRLLLEGATPASIDAAARGFGFAMGPCAVADLAGIDVGWRIRQERGETATVADAIHALGRHGQKTGGGFFDYPAGSRLPETSPEIEALIASLSAQHGTVRRSVSADEIVERLVFPLINEGAQLLAEGIALRPGDIDVIWIHGYGFPKSRGGPMYYADAIGPAHIAQRLAAHAAATADPTLAPTAMLARLAAEGRRFADLG